MVVEGGSREQGCQGSVQGTWRTCVAGLLVGPKSNAFGAIGFLVYFAM